MFFDLLIHVDIISSVFNLNSSEGLDAFRFFFKQLLSIRTKRRLMYSCTALFARFPVPIPVQTRETDTWRSRLDIMEIGPFPVSQSLISGSIIDAIYLSTWQAFTVEGMGPDHPVVAEGYYLMK